MSLEGKLPPHLSESFESNSDLSDKAHKTSSIRDNSRMSFGIKQETDVTIPRKRKRTVLESDQDVDMHDEEKVKQPRSASSTHMIVKEEPSDRKSSLKVKHEPLIIEIMKARLINSLPEDHEQPVE